MRICASRPLDICFQLEHYVALRLVARQRAMNRARRRQVEI